MVLHYNRFIILFTQLRHRKQTQKIKNIFNLKVQYFEKYSSTSYIAAAFMLASRHTGLELKILYYCVLYSPIQ